MHPDAAAQWTTGESPDRGQVPRAMGDPIRLLIVSRDEAGTERAVAALRRGGFDPAWQRVDTEPALEASRPAVLPDLLERLPGVTLQNEHNDDHALLQ